MSPPDPAAEDALIPLSALQHRLFCPRQNALIHVEGLWAEDAATAEGRLLHERVDAGGTEEDDAMLMLVAYDVNTESPAGRRLRRVARACLDHGQRVQNSVFECEVEPAQWTALRARLVAEIDA